LAKNHTDEKVKNRNYRPLQNWPAGIYSYMTTAMQPKRWQEKSIAIKDSDAINYYNECYTYFALGKESFVPIEDTLEVMRIADDRRKHAGFSQ